MNFLTESITIDRIPNSNNITITYIIKSKKNTFFKRISYLFTNLFLLKKDVVFSIKYTLTQQQLEKIHSHTYNLIRDMEEEKIKDRLS